MRTSTQLSSPANNSSNSSLQMIRTVILLQCSKLPVTKHYQAEDMRLKGINFRLLHRSLNNLNIKINFRTAIIVSNISNNIITNINKTEIVPPVYAKCAIDQRPLLIVMSDKYLAISTIVRNPRITLRLLAIIKSNNRIWRIL